MSKRREKRDYSLSDDSEEGTRQHRNRKRDRKDNRQNSRRDVQPVEEQPTLAPIKERIVETSKSIEEKKPRHPTRDMDDYDLLTSMGVKGFGSSKGLKVSDNIEGFSKIKATSKIFNLLIQKRGTYQNPIDIKLKK
ncbi:hypothetical protein EIN_182930 [Entamoeba invadens IP1]|uniref:hypothetical protein n=1 Tax=Entamoeba invadens IP1 TaxID=370355 RepID=UPI0002C3E019|nr:hypothetical protein EIN_182930 [Entamoeba invadens IP1]ELP94036.1 hypothetical protein EIN_182930 [Entamoeba invadens IP1]|eukprot:XP_004260807.1 hypothetical protein EIN_182930 [Entamoeba invadens IP1]